jgi:hypothetical protein
VDLGHEGLDRLLQAVRARIHPRRAAPHLSSLSLVGRGRRPHTRDALGDFPGILRRAEDRPRDLLAGMALLVGGVRDLRGNQAHPGDRLADRRDGGRRSIGCFLDGVHLPGDTVRGARRLAG